MNLDNLPAELIGEIAKFLSRGDQNQLSQTCHEVYEKILFQLYSHLDLSCNRTTCKNLQYIAKNMKLVCFISENTTFLNLEFKNGDTGFFFRDLLSIIGPKSAIKTLIFSGFYNLNVAYIYGFIGVLPNLSRVEYKSCEFTCKQNNQEEPSPTGSNNYTFNTIKQISFYRVDFENQTVLDAYYPNVTHLNLGINKGKVSKLLNKRYNPLLLHSLYEHCPAITHLEISLPDVSVDDLCSVVRKYGKQLQYLSIYCANPKLLLVIAASASQLVGLEIRSESDTLVEATANLPIDGRNGDEKTMKEALNEVLIKCKELKYFKFSSCHFKEYVSDLVWDSCLKATLVVEDLLKQEQYKRMYLDLRREASQLNTEQIITRQTHREFHRSIIEESMGSNWDDLNPLHFIFESVNIYTAGDIRTAGEKSIFGAQRCLGLDSNILKIIRKQGRDGMQ